MILFDVIYDKILVCSKQFFDVIDKQLISRTLCVFDFENNFVDGYKYSNHYIFNREIEISDDDTANLVNGILSADGFRYERIINDQNSALYNHV